MIEQLKKHFGEAFVYSKPDQSIRYEWFKTKEGETFGILREALSKEEKALLSSLFIQEQPELTTLTSEENTWFNILFTDNYKNILFDAPSKVRITQFTIKNKLTEKKEFTETIKSVFAFPIVLIWEKDDEGIIIEKEYIKDLESFEFLTQALISDFLIDLSFYVGGVQSCVSIETLNKSFLFEKKNYSLARKILKKNVYNHYEMLPFMLLNGVEQEDLNNITQLYLKYILDNGDMLKTIQTFFKSNMNISNTAKKLYVHRNSVQYRIDKLIENTGIDIKNFPEAVAVYLLLHYSKFKNLK